MTEKFELKRRDGVTRLSETEEVYLATIKVLQAERDALRKIVHDLVRWTELTPAEFDGLIRQAAEALKGKP